MIQITELDQMHAVSIVLSDALKKLFAGIKLQKKVIVFFEYLLIEDVILSNLQLT